MKVKVNVNGNGSRQTSCLDSPARGGRELLEGGRAGDREWIYIPVSPLPPLLLFFLSLHHPACSGTTQLAHASYHLGNRAEVSWEASYLPAVQNPKNQGTGSSSASSRPSVLHVPTTVNHGMTRTALARV